MVKIPVGPRNAVHSPYRVRRVLARIPGPQIQYSHSRTYSQMRVLVTTDTRFTRVLLASGEYTHHSFYTLPYINRYLCLQLQLY
jgi:hypothetical protein